LRLIAILVFSSRFRCRGGYGGRAVQLAADDIAHVGVKALDASAGYEPYVVTQRQAPHGTLEGPSPALVADKTDFCPSRVQRWFGRTWP
jgi:hypothetical protein